MSRLEPRQLAAAMRDLGQAVLKPSAWFQIMRAIIVAAGGSAGALLQSDVAISAGAHGKPDEHFAFGHYVWDARTDLAVRLLLQGKRIVTERDIGMLDATRVIREKLPNSNGISSFVAVGFRACSAHWLLSIQRTAREGTFKAHEARLLAPLSDRLSEVATLSTEVGRIALNSAMNALESAGQPALAVDRFGRILYINKTAESLFDDEIHIKSRRLFTTDQRAKTILKKINDRLRISRDTEPIAMEPIVVHRTNKSPLLCRVLPIHEAARNPFLGAKALLRFRSLNRAIMTDTELIAELYGLSKAEAKVAERVAQGLTPEMIAGQLAVATATVRNQLKAVFTKTGTHRQGELIALLANIHAA